MPALPLLLADNGPPDHALGNSAQVAPYDCASPIVAVPIWRNSLGRRV